MGDRTTRPHATLRACRIRRYIAPLAGLAGAPVLAQTGTAYVDRVIDGDTISVRLDGDRYTVRFTGVDTPETKHATRGVEPDGPEAADDTTARLTGGTVRRCTRRLRSHPPVRHARQRRERQRDPHPRRVRQNYSDLPVLPTA